LDIFSYGIALSTLSPQNQFVHFLISTANKQFTILDSLDKNHYDSLEFLISSSQELQNFIPAGKKIKQDKLSALISQQEQFASSTRDLQQKLFEQKEMDETIRIGEESLTKEEFVFHVHDKIASHLFLGTTR